MRNTRSMFLSLAVAASLAGHALAQNDDCSGAIMLTNGANGPFSNASATTSVPAWPCAAGGNDLWYMFVAGAAGTLTADTCGSGFDTCIEIFDGIGGCGALLSLGCNDDSCGLQSSLAVPVTAGVYYVRVGGYGGSTGSFTLNVNGPIGSGTVATNTAIGAGCIASFASFYEYFATGTVDLSASSFSMVPAGAGYIVLPGLTTWVTPSVTATSLTLGDDSEAAVTLSAPFNYPGGSTSSLQVCSNGYVSVASNGTSFTPVVVDMLDALNTGWWCWHDMNPTIAGSGQVKFEEVAGVAYVTFDGVYDYGGTTPNTFQFQFDLSAGTVHVLFQSLSTSLTANEFLVGYSPGGTSANSGGVDLSVAIPATITLGGADILPLVVTGLSRPVTNTNWNLETGNIPPAGVVGVDVFGFTDPGINDLAFLGLPGCGLRSTLDVLLAWIPAGATHAYSLAIPNNPSLVNVHVFTTSAVFQPGVNAFGAITANGIDGKIGDL